MMSQCPRLSILLMLVAAVAAIVHAESPRHTQSAAILAPPVSALTLKKQRERIQTEIGRNHAAIQNLYAFIENLPRGKYEERGCLENQIHEYDARNDWLFEELDQIDRQEFRSHREQQLRAAALDLSKQSKLRKQQATRILKALDDGTWARLVDREWTCRDPDSRATADVPIQLFVENVQLKSELHNLRSDLQQLRAQLNSATTRGK